MYGILGVNYKMNSDILQWYTDKLGLNSRDYQCLEFSEYIRYYKDLHPQVPESVWHYYNWEYKVWDEFRDFMVYWDSEEGEKILLNDVGFKFPVWRNKVKDFWVGHPCKHLFYIVVPQKTDSYVPT